MQANISTNDTYIKIKTYQVFQWVQKKLKMNVSTMISSEKIQKIWMKPIYVMKSVLPFEDLNLTMLQRHQEGLTRKICQSYKE